MDKSKIKEIKELVKNKWINWGVIIILLIIILSLSGSIRLSNLSLLKDSTTGEYIPLALDPFYFLRISQTILENGGELPNSDKFRYFPDHETPWHGEIMPDIVVFMYKVYSSVDVTVSLEYIDVISPVIFYILAMLIFFYLVYTLSNNKWMSILSVVFLAFAPGYLYRTMAGFSDHESIGMLGLFLSIFFFLIAVSYIGNVKEKAGYLKHILLGVLVGFGTSFSIATWTGISRTQAILFGISIFLIWIFNTHSRIDKEKIKKFMVSMLIFYISFFISIFIFVHFLFGFDIQTAITFFTGSQGIISSFTFLFMILDFIVFKFSLKYVKSKYRVIYSLVLSIILGVLGLIMIGKSPFSVVSSIINSLIHPFGLGRIGLTVAENQAPYLTDWIEQVGRSLFWMFFLGILMFGYSLTKNIKKTKSKILFLLLFSLMIIGIIFSKLSQTSVLDGDNFLSVIFYFIPLIAFWIYFFYLYFCEDFFWKRNDAVLFSIIFFTIISGRAASRMFFAIMPFMCLMAAYLVAGLFKEWNLSRDKILKIVFIIFSLVALLLSFYVINVNYQTISITAKYTSPSANSQWQNAMEWVRENTGEDSVFAHWWDYGYWVQSLGKRRTVCDGGHFENSYGGDHKIGRYVLTTPNPNTSLSFFKSMNVSYLLIDQTDLGKYTAYSKIGSDNDWDRLSMIPVGVYNPQNVQETANDTILIYNIQGPVDEDIYYDSNGDGNDEVFLAGPTYNSIGEPTYKYYLIAVIINKTSDSIKQPTAVFVNLDSSKQYRIPLRYVYFGSRIHDFNYGLDSMVSIIPRVDTNSVDPIGAMIYLSPKVSKSLFAQLYLLDDAFNKYPTIELAYKQQDIVVEQLESQGLSNLGDMIYYKGFRGPIKIWNTTNIPEEILFLDEFYNQNHEESDYAILDKYFE